MICAVNTSPFHLTLTRKFNVWYSVRDGNWNDPGTWMSNGLKRGHICPQAGDDVHIHHTVDYSNKLRTGSYSNNSAITDFNYLVNNLFISTSGKLTANGTGLNQNRLTIAGNLYCEGTLDFSGATQTIDIELRGVNNTLNHLITGTQNNIIYNSPFNQPVLNLIYYNLQISNANVKYLLADLTVLGTLITDNGSSLELGTFNSTFNLIQLQGALKKSSSTGAVNFNNTLSIVNGTGAVVFSGSPTVNISGDITLAFGDMRTGFNLGSGIVNVLTNQSWMLNTGGNLPVAVVTNGSIIIASGKTLTISAPSGNAGGLLINGSSTINGTDGTSTLNIDGGFAYGYAYTPMSTGVFNHNHSTTSNIIVATGVIMTLPFASFYDLNINGTATISTNTTVNHTLTLSGSLQLSTFDFTCLGTILISGSLLKTGAGTVNINICTSTGNGTTSFTGNPTVNLSGNFTGDYRAGVNFGTTPVNILQSLSFATWVGGNTELIMTASFIIASGKTLTNVGLSATTGGMNISGTITGADSNAIFDNRSVFTYKNAIAPMTTGKLYCNQANNLFQYSLPGAQDITVPGDPIPGYKNLTLNGSGAKRLLGNVSVKGTYTLTSPATLNSNGFTLMNP